jgi:hypothetical protein
MKIAIVLVGCFVIAFVLLIVVVDRFILAPAPASAPVRAK